MKDKSLFLCFYVVNTLCLILFFNLTDRKTIEIAYPVSITLFLLTILIIVEWVKYYNFNLNLGQVLREENHKLKVGTYEQRRVESVINWINENHRNNSNTLKENYDKKAWFITQWIHKLKTPISVIDLIIQKYAKDSALSLEVLKDIEVENKSLHSSVEQVLTLLRLQEFEKDYEVTSINLLEALRQIINHRKSQFIYNKVFPILDCKTEVYVLSDYKWNELMLSQIISNAIKYSANGKDNKKLYFSLERNEKHTTLAIKDEGIGIADYDLRKIFEPFFTGENGRKYRNSTGIGLYICKEISQKLGHDIRVYSKLGEGTEVKITYLSKL
jgi:signal transduction histidine kinase